MKTLAAIFLMLLLAGCAATKLYTPASGNENKRAEATLAELKQGYDIYSSRCNKCHGLNAPKSRTPEQWTKVLDAMAPKAKLSAEQKSLVYKYLVNY